MTHSLNCESALKSPVLCNKRIRHMPPVFMIIPDYRLIAIPFTSTIFEAKQQLCTALLQTDESHNHQGDDHPLTLKRKKKIPQQEITTMWFLRKMAISFIVLLTGPVRMEFS